jgi:uncharacterized protein (TIGR03643 family)
MSISRALKDKFDSYDLESTDRIIRMAWEDRTSYAAITLQFNLTPSEIVHFMRYNLEESRFKRWRKRVFEKGSLKNAPHSDFRFKCRSQRIDGSTKNHK